HAATSGRSETSLPVVRCDSESALAPHSTPVAAPWPYATPATLKSEALSDSPERPLVDRLANVVAARLLYA
ncbi:MAG: hypothetical protein ACXVH3_33880, partial [Solirubrobacteraceae bacterium]